MQFRLTHFAGVLAVAIVAIVIAIVSIKSAVQHRIAMQTAQTAFGREKLNILILGYQDDEATTDTIILAHLDVDRRMATLVSIPRDTWVQLPGHDATKINAAYAYGGAPSSAKAVARLLGGVPIDATIALQPDGAAQIVDAMGGLRVDVRNDMDYDDNNGSLHIHLKKGEQSLNGDQVLGYIRFRHDAESDFGRVRRQQQILKLMMDQLGQPQNWSKLPHLLNVARKNVATSISDRRLMALSDDLPERAEREHSYVHAARQSRLGGRRVRSLRRRALVQTDRAPVVFAIRTAARCGARGKCDRISRVGPDDRRRVARRRLERAVVHRSSSATRQHHHRLVAGGAAAVAHVCDGDPAGQRGHAGHRLRSRSRYQVIEQDEEVKEYGLHAR